MSNPIEPLSPHVINSRVIVAKINEIITVVNDLASNSSGGDDD